jgi:hypothetical protein
MDECYGKFCKYNMLDTSDTGIPYLEILYGVALLQTKESHDNEVKCS